jgi:hypothetical protein
VTGAVVAVLRKAQSFVTARRRCLCVPSLDSLLPVPFYLRNWTLLLTRFKTVKPERHKTECYYIVTVCKRFSFTLKMEAADSSETLVSFYKTILVSVALRPDSRSWPSLTGLRDHRHNTLGRIPLYEWSARRRDLYLTTQHSQQTSMPPVGFEPTFPASERPQTHALDRAATGIGRLHYISELFVAWYLPFVRPPVMSCSLHLPSSRHVIFK